MEGMCGNYDGNSENDFKTKDGAIEKRPSVFGESWKVATSCSNVAQDAPTDDVEACAVSSMPYDVIRTFTLSLRCA